MHARASPRQRTARAKRPRAPRLAQELRNSTFASVAACASRSLGRELFARLHALDATYHARNPPGALSRVVERSSRAASALLSVVVLHIAPTALELGLVTALLSSQCGPLFGGVAVATVGGCAPWRRRGGRGGRGAQCG